MTPGTVCPFAEMFLDAEQSYAEVGTKESSLIKRIPEGEQYHAVNIQSRSPKDIARYMQRSLCIERPFSA